VDINELRDILLTFWESKEDIERWVGFEENKYRIIAELPEVWLAWNQYKNSKLLLNTVLLK